MKGESLLILPGWGSNSLRWQRVKELLEKKGIEVLVLDLPGFGVAFSPQKAWSRDDYINWIFQKVKDYNPPAAQQGKLYNNWQKFNLLGHSFGGGLAVKLAANFSEKVDKLILLSPAIIRRKSIKTYLFYYISELGKKVFSLPGFKILHPLAEKLIYKLAGTRDYYLADGIMKETMKKIGKEEPLEMILEKIKIPTLILWGERDDVLPVKDAYYIKEKISDSELKIIPKAKHSPHRESPEELAGIIVQFIKGPT